MKYFSTKLICTFTVRIPDCTVLFCSSQSRCLGAIEASAEIDPQYGKEHIAFLELQNWWILSIDPKVLLKLQRNMKYIDMNFLNRETIVK